MNMKYAMRSEDTEQINVISWASWQMQKYPELKWLHHIPNGGSRNRAEAVKLKQMGVKSGVSDLCLPYPKGIYCGLYIEMKYDIAHHLLQIKPDVRDLLITRQAETLNILYHAAHFLFHANIIHVSR